MQDLDKNFIVETKIKRENLHFYDVEEAPFRIYGLMREDGRFCRMPKEVAYNVSEHTIRHYAHTSGGRVRFVTNSPYVAIFTEMDNITRIPHGPLTGTASFDIYVDEGKGSTYYGTFVPPYDMSDGYESVHDFPDQTERVVTINFPLYSGVKKLYVGLEGNAVIKASPDYKYEEPIVYYGSSVTQGGCASRPGTCYQNVISRRLDVDFWNLGFSDGARGEKVMTEYLAGLKMRMLVCDLDHNLPYEELKKRHLPLYRTVRAVQPELPIIFISAADILMPHAKKSRLVERREVIRETYRTAIAEGDKNVYFIDGEELFAGEDRDQCTVDRIHPNDLGFYRMAMRIEKEIIPLL